MSRSEAFSINRSHKFAPNLVLGAFAEMPRSAVVQEASPFRGQGVISGSTPQDLWMPDSYLNRYVLNFDGSDDYVEYPMGAQCDGGYLTVCAWVNPATSGNSYPRIIDRVYNGQFCLYLNELNRQLYVALSTSGGLFDNAVTSGASIPDGEWTHVAFRYIGNWVQGYVNGQYNSALSLTNGTLSSSTSAVRLGQRVDAGTNRTWKGKLADVCVFNTILPDGFIADIADPSNINMSGLIAPPQQLRASFRIGWDPPAKQGVHVWSHTRNKPTKGQNATSVNIARPDGVVNGDLLVAVLVGVGGPQDHKLAGWTKKSRYKVTSLWCETYSKIANNEPDVYTVDWAATYVYGGGAILCIKGMTNPKHYATNNNWEAYGSTLQYTSELAADEPDGLELFITTSEYGYNGVLNNLPAEYERIVDDAIGQYLGLFTKRVAAGAGHQPAPLSTLTTTFQTSVARFADSKINCGQFPAFITAGAGQRPDRVILNPDHEYARNLIFGTVANASGDRVVRDISPYVRNATLGANVVWHQGLQRHCFVTTNTAGYFITLPTIFGSLDSGNAWTACCWYFPSMTPTNYSPVFGLSNCGIGARGTSKFEVWRQLNSGSNRRNSSAISTTEWTHACAVISGADNGDWTIADPNTSIYMNGALDNQFTANAGNGSYNTWGECGGTVADLFVWNIPLDAGIVRRFGDPSNTMYDGMLMAPPRKLWNIPWNPDQTILDTAKSLKPFVNAVAGERPEQVSLNPDHEYAKSLLHAFAYSDGRMQDLGPSRRDILPASVSHEFEPTINRKHMTVATGGSFVGHDCGTMPTLNGISKATVSAWMKRNTAGTYLIVGVRDSASTLFAIQIWSDNVLYCVCGGSYCSLSWPGNGWHHVGMCFDGSQAGNNRLLMYLDGVLQSPSYTGSPPATLQTFSTSFCLASHLAGSGYYGTGSLGDVLVHADALSAPTIKRLGDPSNTMYDGLFKSRPHTLWNIPFFELVGGAFKAAWAQGLNIYKGMGI